MMENFILFFYWRALLQNTHRPSCSFSWDKIEREKCIYTYRKRTRDDEGKSEKKENLLKQMTTTDKKSHRLMLREVNVTFLSHTQDAESRKKRRIFKNINCSHLHIHHYVSSAFALFPSFTRITFRQLPPPPSPLASLFFFCLRSLHLNQLQLI